MKNLLLAIGFCFAILFAGSASAQTYQSLLVQLEESSNPAAIKRQGPLQATADGGYLQAGTWGDGEFSRAIISKMDSLFQPEWSYRINYSITGGNTWQVSYGIDVLAQPNGNIVLLAAINQSLLNGEALQNLDYAVISISPDSANGYFINTAQRFGGQFSEYPHSIKPTQDGGLIISGISNSEAALNLPSRAHTYIVKLDANGDLEWDKRFGGPNGGCATAELTISNLLNKGLLRRNIIQTQDQGFVFTQYCGGQTYITKVDQQGALVWSQRFQSNDNLFDGFFDPNWNIALGAGAGTGGTIAQVRELSDGRLAFLGNHFAYFLVVFGNNTGANGGGLSLPFSYCFVTDSAGNFQYGNAFFRETGQADLPIEMMAEDFSVIQDDLFVISCGINRYTQNNATSYHPALLRFSPQASNNNEAIGLMSKIGDSVRYKIQDYPWGMDPIAMQFDPSRMSGVSSFDNQLFGLAYDHSVEACGETVPVGQLYSFPINLSLQAAMPASTNLPNAPLMLNSLGAINLNRMEECLQSSTTAIEITQISSGGVSLAPNVSDGDFRLIMKDSKWQQAEVSLISPRGEKLYQGNLASQEHLIPTNSLSAGLYFVIIQKGQNRISLKGILLD